MKNIFKELSDSRKLAMLSLSIEEVYNEGFTHGESLRPFAKFVLRANSQTVEQPKPLTPNQQRAAVIQQAREFAESKFFEGHRKVGQVVDDVRWGHQKVQFIINSEKGTVVCLLRLAYTNVKEVQERGIAKCMPGDVFNEDIGKAIALAKVLEIEVPKEFTHAVQPTEKVVGMQVYDAQKRGTSKYNTVISDAEWPGEGFCCVSSASSRRATILDDTNAKYEEVSK